MVQIMGSITKRKNKSGVVRYRGVIRINREGYPAYTESKTFSRKSLAENWIKKREAEIEANPDILLNRAAKTMRLRDVINKYINEMSGHFGRTHTMSLALIARTPLASKQLNELRREDYTAFADSRLNGRYEGLGAISPATLNGDMMTLRSVLKQAKLAWGLDVNLQEFEDAMLGLRHSRKVSASKKRTRTPTSDELQLLTTFFYKKYMARRSAYPMHLIMWLAIYTARRQDELTRLRLSDYNDGWWLVRDAKSPTGSTGHNINTRVTAKAEVVIDEILKDDVRDLMKYPNRHWNDDLLLPLSNNNISAAFTRACKLLGIDDLRFHDLRHEAATRLAEEGLTVPELQQVTGHESWNSLQRYVNIKPRKTLLEFHEAMSEARRALLENRQ